MPRFKWISMIGNRPLYALPHPQTQKVNGHRIEAVHGYEGFLHHIGPALGIANYNDEVDFVEYRKFIDEQARLCGWMM